MQITKNLKNFFQKTKKRRLLVVDDDARLRDLLKKFLTENNFNVDVANDATSAGTQLAQNSYDLMLLDVMMPGQTGLSFMTSIRESDNPRHRYLPILLLTALGEAEERIQGLESGADDYLSKPFEPRELILRIEKLIERCHPAPLSNQDIMSFGSMTFDVFKGILENAQGEIIHLTPAELDLLQIFAKQPRISLSREDIVGASGVNLSPRTVDVQITRLRKKIEADPREPTYLRTVRHKGYALWPD